MQFETTRSPLGELVYQLKYRNGQLDDIVETAVAFVAEHWGGNTDCVVSPPPSLHRTRQPAVLIAEGIAKSLGVPCLPSAAVKTTATQQMKNVPLQERAPLLMEHHCRNNVGNWPTREVPAPGGAKGFDYYSVKDRAMADAAEYGLML